MSKRQFFFYFEDEPQFRGKHSDTREYIAHLFRAYRRQPGMYEFARIGPHRYRVRQCLSNAVAIIEARTD